MTITNNLYVRLDEVTKIIFRKMPLYSSIYDELTLDTIKEVSSLPTINLSQDSTLSEIDEIIEGYNETERRGLYLSDNENFARDVLQELKSRLLSSKL